MSKERIKPSGFAKSWLVVADDVVLSAEQKKSMKVKSESILLAN